MIGCIQVLSAFSPSPQVAFEQSMKNDASFDISFLKTQKDWRTLKFLYNGYKKNSVRHVNLYTIPAKIHFICLQDSLPKRCQELMATWKKYHPTWTIKVWTKADIQGLNLINKKAYDAAKTIEEKTNIARYEVLYRQGGLCVDPNFECLRPFDEIHQSSEFYAGIGHCKNPALVQTNLIGSKAAHRILQQCIAMISDETRDMNSGCVGGAQMFTQCFLHLAPALYSKVVPFPTSFFYPVKMISMDEKTMRTLARPETFAIPYLPCN